MSFLETPTTPLLAPAERPRRGESLYRVVWRWHFYAGLLVSPVLILVAITGAIYVFRSEVEDARHAGLRFVEPIENTPMAAGVLIDLARRSYPDRADEPATYERPGDPRRAVLVRFGKTFSDSLAVYVDPYRGKILGAVGPGDGDAWKAFFDGTLKLHRELFAGSAGRIVVELVVGWSLVLLATGAYLWWPRRVEKVRGVWWPRWAAKPYTVLRDLHAIVGMAFLAPIALIAVTGLFYTIVWGGAMHLVLDDHAATSKTGAVVKPLAPEAPVLSIDRIETVARRRYPGRNLTINLPEPSAPTVKVVAGNDFNNSYGEFVSATFEIDRTSGATRSHTTLAEDPKFWWHGWAYVLHVGSVYGPATKVAWLVACLVLAGLPATGLLMWIRRRPKGKAGFPRKPDRPVPLGLIALIAATGGVMPVVGASMVVIGLGEWAWNRRGRRRGRPDLAPAQP